MEPLLKWGSVLVFGATVLFAAESVTERGLWNNFIGGLVVWMIAGSLLLASLAISTWYVMLASREEEKPVILKPHPNFWNQRRPSASIPMSSFRKAA